jgi:hypothetical protein
MNTQKLSRIKKTLATLMVVACILAVTAAAVNAKNVQTAEQ